MVAREYGFGLLCFISLCALLLVACTPEEQDNLTANLVMVRDSVGTTGASAATEIKEFISEPEERRRLKMEYGEKLAQSIVGAGLVKIDVSKVHTQEEFFRTVDQLNILIELSNKNIGTTIAPMVKDDAAYQQYQRSVNRYAPLIDNYNGLIDASYDFNVEDEQTADVLIGRLTGFSTEVLLISSGFVHKMVFATVGDLARAAGITQLTGVCNSCVSTTMSAMYWAGKDFVVNKGGEYAELLIT